MAKTILVVDDEKRLVSVLEAYLQQEGYKVLKAHNGLEALTVVRGDKPDLIVLDVMMPEMDGLQFMQLHRQEFDTPIILLTAKVESEDRILGLELGADDYVTKPFKPRELLARIRAVLRRMGETRPVAQKISVGEITLDREEHTVRLRGENIDLTPSEFDLLSALMSQPGRVFTRLELLDRIQGTAYEGYARTIDVHIKNLRAKLQEDSRDPRYIETVYGVGYRLKREHG